MYKFLKKEQLLLVFPGKKEIIQNLLKYLEGQSRVFYNNKTDCYCANNNFNIETDKEIISAFWVLLDFIDKVEFHSASDFPVKLVFLAKNELYEVIYVGYEQEHLINNAAVDLCKELVKRIVIVDDINQINNISIPNIIAYCKVDIDGKIQYYKYE